MTKEQGFPFAAIRGQEDLKQALILACINPAVGGVLAVGGKGCGKSTIMRSVRELTEKKVAELPLNCTADRLTGSLDLTGTIKQGKKQYDSGILTAAEGQFLYCDEINLLPDSLLHTMVTLRDTTENPWILLGTMNPEEGMLTAHVLDRFGLCVEVHGSREPVERLEILQSVLEYEKDPEDFRNQYREEMKKLKEKIRQASERLSETEIPEETETYAVEICKQAGCPGSRGDLYLTEAARALAAWEGEKTVQERHVRRAAAWVLPHRMKREEPEAAFAQNRRNAQCEEEQEAKEQQNPGDERTEQDFSDVFDQSPEEKENGTKSAKEQSRREETIFLPEEGLYGAGIPRLQPGRKKRKGCGKRSRTRAAKNGRMIRSAIPTGTCTDPALAATLRAAAPYQRFRKRDNVAICIEKSDFREKVRECRIGASILFVVDASRSMEAERRMAFAKGAILSILQEAYCKRDQVAMLTFRDNRADLCLGFTRSVELAKERLDRLPIGGNTPLALGLQNAWYYLKRECHRNPDLQPVLVLLTDGKANASVTGDPFEEALRVAGVFGEKEIPSLVIDTETGFLRMGFAEEIAEAMHADCIRLDDLLPEEAGKMLRKQL